MNYDLYDNGCNMLCARATLQRVRCYSQRTPKVSPGAGTAIRHSGAGGPPPRIDATYQSKVFFQLPSHQGRQDGYSLINGRLYLGLVESWEAAPVRRNLPQESLRNWSLIGFFGRDGTLPPRMA